ncbi:hypothetical protein NDU88_005711 [Pleurodeles waltl]|uniref:G-protein coupled receptors family 1 profile domain-containing protein n=1 Tax=Pleurodeles waltl TaxID=8319 RepID=A0AAV7WDH1_PLEWA|nr:hypothetical protein NDU88_005711 [Pleurodeles waltl]
MKPAALTGMCIKTIMCILGIVGNSALIYHSMPKARCRIEPYKVLMTNLAVSNLLTNCLVDLPDSLVDIYGSWFLGEIYCKVFLFAANLSSISSILTTLSICVFWFRKLVASRPGSNHLTRSGELRLVSMAVSLSWAVAFSFSAPLIYFSSLRTDKSAPHQELLAEPSGRKELLCREYFPSPSHKYMYEVIYLTFAVTSPIMLMMFINVKMLIVLLRNRKRVRAMRLCAMGRCAPASMAGNLGCQARAGSGTSVNTPVTSSCGVELCSAPVLSAGHCKIEEPLQIRRVLFEVDSNGPYSYLSAAHGLVSFRANPCLKTFAMTNRHIGLATNTVSDMEQGPLFESPKKPTIFSISEVHAPKPSLVDLTVGFATFPNGIRQQPEPGGPHMPGSVVNVPAVKIVEVVGVSEDMVASHVQAPYSIPLFCSLEDRDSQCAPLAMPAVSLCPLELQATAPLQTPDPTSPRRRHLGQDRGPRNKPAASAQFRATLSITAVVGVFSLSWATHLALRITSNVDETKVILEIANQIAASYTSVIPFIFLYGMNKCTCGFWR